MGHVRRSLASLYWDQGDYIEFLKYAHLGLEYKSKMSCAPAAEPPCALPAFELEILGVVSLRVTMCVCVSLLYVCVRVCVSLCMCLCVTVSVSISVFHYVCVNLPLCMCLCIIVCVSLCLHPCRGCAVCCVAVRLSFCVRVLVSVLYLHVYILVFCVMSPSRRVCVYIRMHVHLHGNTHLTHTLADNIFNASADLSSYIASQHDFEQAVGVLKQALRVARVYGRHDVVHSGECGCGCGCGCGFGGGNGSGSCCGCGSVYVRVCVCASVSVSEYEYIFVLV